MNNNNVIRKAYEFVDSEKALQLPNSKGSEKSRLHLSAYEGAEGKDRFAVAAEIITFQPNETPSLGRFDRIFNVLHSHTDETTKTTTWYKINKNSLKKRLNLSSKEIKAIEKDPTVDLISKKIELRNQWLNLKIHGGDRLQDPTSFESRFIDSLVEYGVSPTNYEHLIFWNISQFRHRSHLTNFADAVAPEILIKPKDTQIKEGYYNLWDIKKDSLLVICFEGYGNQKDVFSLDELIDHFTTQGVTQEVKEFLKGDDSPLVYVPIKEKDVDKIERSGKLPPDLCQFLKF